uniref:UBA domain-containing protein n=1 Tax=Rhizophora mucronata TaxID=61149 RepID=A0A2P2J2K7_RHIMU
MSPGAKSKAKSKSKEKPSARSAKEQQKTAVKTSASTNAVGGNRTNAYNPLSGTFHALEVPLGASSPTFNDNRRFKSMDDNDEHSSSPNGTISEYDSVSTNGSCSGESEDPKEKMNNSTRLESASVQENDRREKIRLKNEKKHQRQRERRAQELHERCTGYLMSRKLEVLSQQLVSMGFPPERATLALMLNEGRLEESVNWLFEMNEEEVHNNKSMFCSGGNLKIDISEELARISAMELRYKCSKQEVERAVVTCEGDLMRAERTLQGLKQEAPDIISAQEETVDAKSQKRPHERPAAAASLTIQMRKNERDVNYTKTAAPVTYPEMGTRNIQLSSQSQSKEEKKRGATGPSPSSFLSAVAPTNQVTTVSAKFEVQRGVALNRSSKSQQMMKEPVVISQRPQSVNVMQNPIPSMFASPSVTAGYTNIVPGVGSTISNSKPLFGRVGLANQSSEQLCHPSLYKKMSLVHTSPGDYTSSELQGSSSTMSKSLGVPSIPQGSCSAANAPSPSLTVPSSLGLFTGWGSAGTMGSSHVDWNAGRLMPEFDYNTIDWTLGSNDSSSKSSGLLLGLSSLLRNSSAVRMNSSNGISGFRDGGSTKETTSSASLHEWTSPFAGKDIFSLPRQFVTSPSP